MLNDAIQELHRLEDEWANVHGVQPVLNAVAAGIEMELRELDGKAAIQNAAKEAIVQEAFLFVATTEDVDSIMFTNLRKAVNAAKDVGVRV